MSRFRLSLLLAIFSFSSAWAQWSPAVPVTSVAKEADGLRATMKSGAVLKLQVCSDSIIHVLYSPTATFPSRTDYVVTKTSWPAAQFNVETADKKTTLSTSVVKAILDHDSGSLTFSSGNEQLFAAASNIMTPVTVNGEKTYRGELAAGMYGTHEGFYGLGQHQAGVWNYHGESVDLSQENTNIAIPMLLSSKGYGIFWNNTSRSRVNNRFVHVMYFSSEVADSIDYYFIYGPDFDKIIAGLVELPALLRCLAAGVWLLAMQEPVQVAGRDYGCSAEVSRLAYTRGWHRSRLVLVEPQR